MKLLQKYCKNNHICNRHVSRGAQHHGYERAHVDLRPVHIEIESAEEYFTGWQEYIGDAEAREGRPWIAERLRYNAELRRFAYPEYPASACHVKATQHYERCSKKKSKKQNCWQDARAAYRQCLTDN